ncbi:MAG TPA: hypothetical protein VK463_08675 [Desulfomonilaceae bacterium]|nr:hypothetical protein [Desulfomonilaceae bacterium]
MGTQLKFCLAALLGLLVVAPACPAQVPYGQPPAPMGQPIPGRPPGPQQQSQQQFQQPSAYAFRPDLTNPQFGECLNLEKTWKALWQRYAQEYQRFRMMNPRDAQYQQMALYLQGLKRQLDVAWDTFSSRCVYFPRQK